MMVKFLTKYQKKTNEDKDFSILNTHSVSTSTTIDEP